MSGLVSSLVSSASFAAAAFVSETTVGWEWEHNPFIRVWRGLDPEGDQACTAMGKRATLILRAPDYDGGTKAWVRWPDGSDDIVPGSQVQLE